MFDIKNMVVLRLERFDFLVTLIFLFDYVDFRVEEWWIS